MAENTFATRLAATQAEAGLSIVTLAAAAGLPRQTIHKLLRGERQPSWETVQRLANALRVSTESFRTIAQLPGGLEHDF